MILGRSPVLWYAMTAAALNAAVIVFGVGLSDIQVGALNILVLSVLGVIANELDPLAAGTLAATIHAPAVPNAASSTAMASSFTAAADPTPSAITPIAGIDPTSLQALVALIERLTTPAPADPGPIVPVATVPAPIVTADAAPATVPPVAVTPSSAWAQSNGLPPDGTTGG